MSSQQTEASGELIALADAAEQLGVHYMTAYRYVRTGRMYAVKRGGQWWVEQDAIDTARAEVGVRRAAGAPREMLVEPFETRLLAGDVGGCWDLVTDALRSGAAPSEVHHRLLHPALVRVGERWADGEISIAAEHRATSTANRIIGQLGPLFRHPGRRRGTVVIGAVAGDPHALPSAMLTDLLTDRRLNVVDLGANTPVASFVETANEADDLVGVGVCVVLEALADVAVEQITALRAALPSTLLVVGGPGLVRHHDTLREVADQITETAEQVCDAFEAAATANRKDNGSETVVDADSDTDNNSGLDEGE